MWYELIITVDCNDADYSTAINKIAEEDLDKLRPLIEAIANFEPYETETDLGYKRRHTHNYPCGEHYPRENLGEKFPKEIYDFPEELFDIFDELCPYPDGGFHSIDSIYITPWREKEKLL